MEKEEKVIIKHIKEKRQKKNKPKTNINIMLLIIMLIFISSIPLNVSCRSSTSIPILKNMNDERFYAIVCFYAVLGLVDLLIQVPATFI